MTFIWVTSWKKSSFRSSLTTPSFFLSSLPLRYCYSYWRRISGTPPTLPSSFSKRKINVFTKNTWDTKTNIQLILKWHLLFVLKLCCSVMFHLQSDGPFVIWLTSTISFRSEIYILKKMNIYIYKCFLCLNTLFCNCFIHFCYFSL